MIRMKSIGMKAVMLGSCFALFGGGAVLAQETGLNSLFVAYEELNGYDTVELRDKHQEVDRFLFEEHKGDFADKGFSVTHTGPVNGMIEIGIAPYEEASAEYLYDQFGTKLVKVVEGQQATTMAFPANGGGQAGAVHILPAPAGAPGSSDGAASIQIIGAEEPVSSGGHSSTDSDAAVTQDAAGSVSHDPSIMRGGPVNPTGDVLSGPANATGDGMPANSPLEEKHQEIDRFLFEEHKGDFADKGFSVTHTGPVNGMIEIGITPYEEAYAEYLYDQFGTELVKVVEGQQATTFTAAEGNETAVMAQPVAAFQEPPATEPSSAASPMVWYTLLAAIVVGAAAYMMRRMKAARR